MPNPLEAELEHARVDAVDGFKVCAERLDQGTSDSADTHLFTRLGIILGEVLTNAFEALIVLNQCLIVLEDAEEFVDDGFEGVDVRRFLW